MVRHTVLVTGANGFVGSALVKFLVATVSYSVRTATRDAVSSRSEVRAFAVGDIDGATNWSAALDDTDIVVHLAARVHVMRDTATNSMAEFRRVNVQGTLALAEQAALSGVTRFVFLSSIKVNGEEGAFSESDIPAPLDDYGISKLEAENGLRKIALRTGLQVIIIRPPLVYGPGVKANFRSLLRMVTRGVPLPLAAVHNKRSFVSVDNLVAFIGATLTHPQAANETFLISDGHDLSTPELIQGMARAANRTARMFSVPVSLLQAAATLTGRRDMLQRLVGSLTVDINKARNQLGFTPPVTVSEGLRRTAAER